MAKKAVLPLNMCWNRWTDRYIEKDTDWNVCVCVCLKGIDLALLLFSSLEYARIPARDATLTSISSSLKSSSAAVCVFHRAKTSAAAVTHANRTSLKRDRPTTQRSADALYLIPSEFKQFAKCPDVIDRIQNQVQPTKLKKSNYKVYNKF